MEFKLKKTYSDEDYKKILTVINAFKAIKTDNGWYLGKTKYRALVDSLILNFGEDPTDPLYIPSYVHQVTLQDDKINKDLSAILRKAQYDFDTGIWSMNDEVFKLFTQYCEQNNINFYVVKDSEKVDIYEKETILSKLEYIENEVERTHYHSLLDNLTLEGLLRKLNDNQIKIAEALKMKVDKIYEEVTVKDGKDDTVVFYYTKFEPLMLFITDEVEGKRTVILRPQDLITLHRQVAEQLVKLKKGEIVEPKRTGTQGPEGT
jgi:hypothetical protein